MSQLLQKQIITVPYTNAVLRNIKTLNDGIVTLRADGLNLPDFAKLSILKDLVLELGKQVSAEYISDVVVLILQQGKSVTLNEYDNRLLLNLENSSVYSSNDKRYTPDTGDLIWTNETITITNTSDNISIILVIDFKEFLLWLNFIQKN